MENESVRKNRERDAVFKYFISRKDILVPLLQFAVERFRGPEMKKKLENALNNEGNGRIRCLNTESASMENGRIIYDSLFDVDIPDEDRFMLRVNVEEQLYGTTPYPLEARAAYYLGRMISDQKNTDFVNDSYGDIRKVVSVWIMLDAPRRLWNTAFRTETVLTPFFGTPDPDERKKFDFFQLVVIYISPVQSEQMEPILGILGTLFSPSLNQDTITEKLKQEYKITVDDEFSEELGKLIATREGDRNYFYDEGLADGRIEGRAEGKAENMALFVSYYADKIRSRMASGMSREAAIDSLEIPDFVIDQVIAELDRTPERLPD